MCGMALELKTTSAVEEDNHELSDMTRRFWIGAALALPVFLLAMAHMIPSLGHESRVMGDTLRWIQFVLAIQLLNFHLKDGGKWPMDNHGFLARSRNACLCGVHMDTGKPAACGKVTLLAECFGICGGLRPGLPCDCVFFGKWVARCGRIGCNPPGAGPALPMSGSFPFFRRKGSSRQETFSR
jgi:hypothetical protein